MGDRNTLIETKENIRADLEEGGVGWIIEYLDILEKSIFHDLFSQSESSTIEGDLLKIAQKKLSNNLESLVEQHLILKPAIIMEWQEIIEALSNNDCYLERILGLIDKYDTAEDILTWSLTNKYQLTENLIFKIYPKIPLLTKPHHLNFPSLEFKLAIAWKRSQSKA